MTTKKEQERELNHKTNVAIILTVIGFFVLGIPLNAVALSMAYQVSMKTKEHKTQIKATVVITSAILQLIVDTLMILSVI